MNTEHTPKISLKIEYSDYNDIYSVVKQKYVIYELLINIVNF